MGWVEAAGGGQSDFGAAGDVMPGSMVAAVMVDGDVTLAAGGTDRHAIVLTDAEIATSATGRVTLGVEVRATGGLNPAAATIRGLAAGHAANNALLWGSRGMGKSSLVKAVHATVNETGSHTSGSGPLKLVEVHREDIHCLPVLLNLLRQRSERVILFCDDLSFDHDDTSYKSLKAALEGGVEGRPGNVIFYATSNRRHLLPRDMIENERSTAINPAEAVEEKVSLSDRFGLWLGFHKCSQDEYLEMVKGYAGYFDLELDAEDLRAQALEWSTTRGSRSGRVAWQFIQDLAGRQGKSIS